MFSCHHTDLRGIDKVHAEGVANRPDNQIPQLPLNIGRKRHIRYKTHLQAVERRLDHLVLAYGRRDFPECPCTENEPEPFTRGEGQEIAATATCKRGVITGYMRVFMALQPEAMGR
jgi:hypothetical protein